MAIKISPTTQTQIDRADQALTDWFNNADQLRQAGFSEKQIAVLLKLCSSTGLLSTGARNLMRDLKEVP